MRLALSLALGFVLTGCVGSLANPAEVRQAFDEAAYAGRAETGSATISGRAFLSIRKRACAGRKVELDPETPFSREWVALEMRRPGWVVVPPDPRMVLHRRTVVADRDGRFVFRDVPAGSYIVTCDMIKNIGLMLIGQVGYAAVVVKEGEQIEGVEVTRKITRKRVGK